MNIYRTSVVELYMGGLAMRVRDINQNDYLFILNANLPEWKAIPLRPSMTEKQAGEFVEERFKEPASKDKFLLAFNLTMHLNFSLRPRIAGYEYDGKMVRYPEGFKFLEEVVNPVFAYPEFLHVLENYSYDKIRLNSSKFDKRFMEDDVVKYIDDRIMHATDLQVLADTIIMRTLIRDSESSRQPSEEFAIQLRRTIEDYFGGDPFRYLKRELIRKHHHYARHEDYATSTYSSTSFGSIRNRDGN